MHLQVGDIFASHKNSSNLWKVINHDGKEHFECQVVAGAIRLSNGVVAGYDFAVKRTGNLVELKPTLDGEPLRLNNNWAILPPRTYEYVGPVGHGIRLTEPEVDGKMMVGSGGHEVWKKFREGWNEAINAELNSDFNGILIRLASNFVINRDSGVEGGQFPLELNENLVELLKKWRVRAIPARLIEEDCAVYLDHEHLSWSYHQCPTCLVKATHWDQDKAHLGFCSEDCFNGLGSSDTKDEKSVCLAEEETDDMDNTKVNNYAKGAIVYDKGLRQVGQVGSALDKDTHVVLYLPDGKAVTSCKADHVNFFCAPDSAQAVMYTAFQYFWGSSVSRTRYEHLQENYTIAMDNLGHFGSTIDYEENIRLDESRCVREELERTSSLLIQQANTSADQNLKRAEQLELSLDNQRLAFIELGKKKSEMHKRAQKAEGSLNSATALYSKVASQSAKILEAERKEKGKYQSELHALKQSITPSQVALSPEVERLNRRIAELEMVNGTLQEEKHNCEIEMVRRQKDLEWTDKADRTTAVATSGRHTLMQSLIRWGFTAAVSTYTLQYFAQFLGQ